MKKKEISLENNIYDLLFKPTTKKILNLIRKKEMNISELSKELGIAYKNTFANIKKLEENGFLYLKKTKEQNNPSIIIPLVSEPIDFHKEKKKFEEKCKKDKEKIKSYFIKSLVLEETTLEDIKDFLESISKFISKKTPLRFETNVLKELKQPKFFIFIIYKKPQEKIIIGYTIKTRLENLDKELQIMKKSNYNFSKTKSFFIALTIMQKEITNQKKAIEYSLNKTKRLRKFLTEEIPQNILGIGIEPKISKNRREEVFIHISHNGIFEELKEIIKVKQRIMFGYSIEMFKDKKPTIAKEVITNQPFL